MRKFDLRGRLIELLHQGATQEAKDAVASLMSGNCITQLADIACAPANQVVRLGQNLRACVMLAWYQAELAAEHTEEMFGSAEGARQIAEVEKASCALCDLLQQLNDRAKQTLARNTMAIDQCGDDISLGNLRRHAMDVMEQVPNLLIIESYVKTNETLTRAAALENLWQKRPRRRGARHKWVSYPGIGNPFWTNVSVFDEFVLWTLAAVADASGNLTLNKNEGKGTLIDFLKAASPFLPSAHIPKALPYARLQRLKKHWATAAEDVPISAEEIAKMRGKEIAKMSAYEVGMMMGEEAAERALSSPPGYRI